MRGWVTLRRWGRVSGNGDATATMVRNINHTKDLPLTQPFWPKKFKSGYLVDNCFGILSCNNLRIWGFLSRVTPCFLRMVVWRKSSRFKEWSLPQLIHCCPTLLPTTSTTVATASETAQASQGTPASGSFFFHIFLENRALEIIEIIAFDHFHCLQVSLRACWLQTPWGFQFEYWHGNQ